MGRGLSRCEPRLRRDSAFVSVRDSDAWLDYYRNTLEELGKRTDTLALIFGKAKNKFLSPAKVQGAISSLIHATGASRCS